jgi:hypothetical protein
MDRPSELRRQVKEDVLLEIVQVLHGVTASAKNVFRVPAKLCSKPVVIQKQQPNVRPVITGLKGRKIAGT